MSVAAKLGRQPEESWSGLHRRLASADFAMEKVLTNESVRNFIFDKAKSLSCCPGYILAGCFTTVLFIAGLTTNLIAPFGQNFKPNLYHIICGPPSTGKSQAVRDTATEPLNTISQEKGLENPIIQKTTSSGLTRKLAKDHMGYTISSEVSDVLYKLLKGDGEYSSGDTSLLCELFSGEQVSLTFGTPEKRELPQQMPFCMYGSIQVYPLAKLIALLDQGQGLIDCFLVAVPLCLRPTPLASQEARERLKALPNSSITDIMSRIYETIGNEDFCFDKDACDYLKSMDEDFITTINEAISSGQTPPKSKRIDLTMRIAMAIHIFASVTERMLNGSDESDISREITMDALEAAVYYVNYCEIQKSILTEFIKDVVSSMYDPPTVCPTVLDVKDAIALFPGKLVTSVALRASGPRRIRSTTDEEFITASEGMTQFGKLVQMRIPRARSKTIIFIKKDVDNISNDDWTTTVTKEAYGTQIEKPDHLKITANIKERLVEMGKLPQ